MDYPSTSGDLHLLFVCSTDSLHTLSDARLFESLTSTKFFNYTSFFKLLLELLQCFLERIVFFYVNYKHVKFYFGLQKYAFFLKKASIFNLSGCCEKLQVFGFRWYLLRWCKVCNRGRIFQRGNLLYIHIHQRFALLHWRNIRSLLMRSIWPWRLLWSC